MSSCLETSVFEFIAVSWNRVSSEQGSDVMFQVFSFDPVLFEEINIVFSNRKWWAVLMMFLNILMIGKIVVHAAVP